MASAINLFCIGCIVTVFINMPVLVDGITCAVCRSSDHGCEGGHVAPTVCGAEFNKCYIYHVYVTHGGEGTLRGCSNQSFTTEGCKSVRTRLFEGILCTSLCDWDGCNSAFGSGPIRSALIRKRSPYLIGKRAPHLMRKKSPHLRRKRSAPLSWKRPPFVITKRLASSVRIWRR